MNRRFSVWALMIFAMWLGVGTQALSAEVQEVKVGRPGSVAFLPLMVMEHQRLLEKHAKATGLGDIKVTWSVFSGGTTINDALLSGDLLANTWRERYACAIAADALAALHQPFTTPYSVPV